MISSYIKSIVKKVLKQDNFIKNNEIETIKKSVDNINEYLSLVGNTDLIWYDIVEYVPHYKSKIYVKVSRDNPFPYITNDGQFKFIFYMPHTYSSNWFDKWSYVNPKNPIKVKKT